MSHISRREALRLAAFGAGSAAVSGSANAASDIDPRVAAPQEFRELPFGSVRPAGWLLTQLQQQAAGVTSHLQHLYAPFTGNAWLADEPEVGGSWWPWEVRGYWCDGTLRCGLLLRDASLIEQSSQLIKYTFSHAAVDGYLGPEALRAAGDANRWPHAVFFRAAMAWHDATGEDDIVNKLQRHYLNSKFNYIADRATTNIEAMLWTFGNTGDARLLQLAEDSWARSQKLLAMSPGSFGLTEKSMLSPGPCGEVHGVTYAELSKIPALLYRATGDPRYLQVAVSAQQKIFEHHLLVGGVPSTSEVLSTTTARDAHETCNVIDYPWTWGYLLQVTGAGMYGDRIERATFNALPGSIRKDWKALQYYSSPNQFLCDEHSCHVAVLKGTGNPTIDEWRYLQRMSYRPSPGDRVVCCPANLSRALPNYISRMWMADTSGEGIAATLYGPARVTWRIGKQKTEIENQEDTDYPYSDAINFTVISARDVRFPLYLRIPAWCATPQLLINDQSLTVPQQHNGFVRILRLWKSGDVLRLTLPMSITTSKWPEDGIAIERGPLVYAYPIEQQWTAVADAKSSPEFPAWNLQPTGRWNYALLPLTDTSKPQFAEASAASKAHHENPWNTPASSITIAARLVRGWELDRTTSNDQPVTFTSRLPDPAMLPNALHGPTVNLRLVPYSNTELRVSIFPYLKNELQLPKQQDNSQR